MDRHNENDPPKENRFLDKIFTRVAIKILEALAMNGFFYVLEHIETFISSF